MPPEQGGPVSRRPNFVAPDGERSSLPAWTRYVLIGLLVAGVAAGAYVLLPRGEKATPSEFTLLPRMQDSSGIMPETTFTLTSTVDLDASAVKKSLSTEPSVELSVDKKDTGTFVIKPKEPLAGDTVLAVKIDQGPIANRTFSWAYQVKAPFQVISTFPGDKGTGVPLNSTIEIELNREGVVDPMNAISITPNIRVRAEVHRNRIVLIPLQSLAEKTIYTVVVKQGLAVSGSIDTLAEQKTFMFETGQQNNTGGYSNFYFDKTFWEFKPGNEPSFSANVYNVPTTNLPSTVYRFNSVDDFINAYRGTTAPDRAWSQFGRVHAYSGGGQKVFQGSLSVQEQQGVKFFSVPQKFDRGYYLLQMTVGSRKIDTWFQMTSLASYIAISPEKTLVSLRNLDGGAPVSGVTVALEGNSGLTDQNGVAMLPTPKEAIEDNTKGYPYADLPGLFAIARSSQGAVAIPFESRYGGFYKLTPSDKWWDYISVDKTMYAPTDTIQFWGLVKQRVGDDIRGSELKIQLTEPYWWGVSEKRAVYGEATAVVSDFNTVTGAITYKGLRPGLYQLSVRRGNEVIVSQNISVSSYIKPAYKLIVEPSSNAVFDNERISYHVKAQFYDGTPVAKLGITYESYNVATGGSGTVTLNAQGEGDFAIVARQASAYRYYPYYLSTTVRPTLAEEGEIATTTSVLVFGSAVRISLDQHMQENTTTVSGDVRRVVLEKVKRGASYWSQDSFLGDPVGGASVTVEKTEVFYDKQEIGKGYDPINKTTYPIYQYSTRKVPAGTDVLTADGKGAFTYSLQVDKGRQFELLFKVKDDQGRVESQQRYVANYDALGAYYDQGLYLQSSDPQKRLYALNDSITLDLQGVSGSSLPSGSKSFMFLKMLGGNIDSYVMSDAPVYQDTFKESYIPNLGVIGVWFNGDRYHDSFSVVVPFESSARGLTVNISKDKSQYRPGEQVKLSIDVSDRNGKGREAEVNVNVLDEAAYDLNPEERDIVNEVYRSIYSNVQTRSSHYTALQSGAEGGGCFLAGTQILLPSGTKSIEDIRLGDIVMTRRDAHSGELIPARVGLVGSHLVNGYLLINDTLKVTANHPLFVNGRWAQAGLIKEGDLLVDEQGNDVRVDSIEKVDGWVRTYNFEVLGEHTYFANGIYVHNAEKGGGESRSDFKDVATYLIVRTDRGGHGEATFKAPDNITNWKVMAQAVTKDLYVGKGIQSLAVTLPFFVDATINNTYLAGDNFIMRIRGTGASQGTKYTVQAPTLEKKSIAVDGNDSVQFDLGKLPVGTHTVTISGQSGSLRDSIKRNVKVIGSYLSRSATKYYDVTPSLENIEGTKDGFTELVFTSQERGKLYGSVRNFSWTYGSRFEDVAGRNMAAILLGRYFGESTDTLEPVLPYLNDGGGLAIFPYADSDLAMSAKYADLMQGELNDIPKNALKTYFESTLTDKKADLEREAIALYGLAALREPVLVSLQNMKDQKDLTLMDHIYVALGLNAVGAKEEARAYWDQHLKSNISSKGSQLFVTKLSDEQNKIATALLANLAAGLQVPEAPALGSYALENRPKETLANLELLSYLKNALVHLRGGDVKFSFTTLRKNETITLHNDESYRLVLADDELKTLRIKNVDGKVGLVSHYDTPTSPQDIAKDSSIHVARSYSVNGKATTTFTDGDMVKVTLTPSYDGGAFKGGYQITDYLPSGLRPVTKYNAVRLSAPYDCVIWPSVVYDQRVSFYDWNPRFAKCSSVHYYARVISKGTYRAEPAIIQSVKDLQSINFSGPSSVTIQ